MKRRYTTKNAYLESSAKRLLDIVLAVFFLGISAPIFVLIAMAVVVTSGRPIFFIHKRIGKNGKVIRMIKFRSMINGAEGAQGKYMKLNESDGPVFKIKNDPRFTKFGKLLSNTGLDELPQFINVLKGEMSIVGPRPLPINEARKLSKDQRIREVSKPGITSSWVVGGSHRLTFKKWMELDKKYIQTAGLMFDLKIIYETARLIASSLIRMVGGIDLNIKKT